MPTSAQITFSSSLRLDPELYPNRVEQMNVNLSAGTYAKGTILGELTATPGTYAAYASGHADGTQVPKGILRYGCVVDGSGNVTLAGEFSQTQKGVPMAIGGGAIWNTSELTGLDANAVTVLSAALVQGTVASGMLHF